MGSLFSSPPASRVTPHDRAVLDLKGQRNKLQQQQKNAESTIAKEAKLASQLLKSGKRERAILVLRKKKLQENLIHKLQDLQNNVDEMVCLD